MKYTIPKNQRFTIPFYRIPTCKKEFSYELQFDQNCLYPKFPPEKDQCNGDLNKLIYFSQNLDCHFNSANFGYKCIENEYFEIYWRMYFNHEKPWISGRQGYAGKVYPNEKVRLDTVCGHNSTLWFFNGGCVEQRPEAFRPHWLFSPWFGGGDFDGCVAPHKMTLNIKIL